jgi:hypothetical protein
LARFKFYLTALVKVFQFLKRRRQRQMAEQFHAYHAESVAREAASAERAAERVHQLQLVEALASKLVEFAHANQEGILKLAEAQTAQTQVLSEWMKGFQTGSTTPVESMPSAHDVWENPYGLTEPDIHAVHAANLPPEFHLAYSLKNDPNPDFDREGRDII